MSICSLNTKVTLVHPSFLQVQVPSELFISENSWCELSRTNDNETKPQVLRKVAYD